MWSAPVTVTPAAAEPITASEAKQFLRVDADETAFDAEIALHITGARSHVEAVTNTRLIEQSLTIKADSFDDLDRLPIGPVSDVTAISYLDTAGAEQTLDGADYEQFGAGLDVGCRPITNGTWPSTIERAGAISVTVTVGYGAAGTSLPPEVRLALLLQIRALFDDTSVDIEPWIVNHRIWL